MRGGAPAPAADLRRCKSLDARLGDVRFRAVRGCAVMIVKCDTGIGSTGQRIYRNESVALDLPSLESQ